MNSKIIKEIKLFSITFLFQHSKQLNRNYQNYKAVLYKLSQLRLTNLYKYIQNQERLIKSKHNISLAVHTFVLK